MKLYWFLLGFLVNSVCWRIKVNDFSNITFPVVISIIVLILIVISEARKKPI